MANHAVASTLLSTHTSQTKAYLIAVLLGGLIASSLLLTGCGFQLRGVNNNALSQPLHNTIVLSINDDATTLPLKHNLTEQLAAVGIYTTTEQPLQHTNTHSDTSSASSATAMPHIKVSNVNLQKYELVGVLTEVRLILSANVSYQVIKNNQAITINSPIQVEQSYQLNKASVSVTDKQGEQIKVELYDSLARRIADQFITLNQPTAQSVAQTVTQ